VCGSCYPHCNRIRNTKYSAHGMPTIIDAQNQHKGTKMRRSTGCTAPQAPSCCITHTHAARSCSTSSCVHYLFYYYKVGTGEIARASSALTPQCCGYLVNERVCVQAQSVCKQRARTPFGRSRGFSELLREDTFRRSRRAHEKDMRKA